MAVYLFAGIPVTDYQTALAWYERLLGSPPSFFPHDTEAVWERQRDRVRRSPGLIGSLPTNRPPAP